MREEGRLVRRSFLNHRMAKAGQPPRVTEYPPQETVSKDVVPVVKIAETRQAKRKASRGKHAPQNRPDKGTE